MIVMKNQFCDGKNSSEFDSFNDKYNFDNAFQTCVTWFSNRYDSLLLSSRF